MSPSGEVTRLLEAYAGGDEAAFGRLFDCIYGELKRVARGQRHRLPGAGATLGTTALVHEAYLKLAGGDAGAGRNRGHFLAIAARAMRHILVDHARHVGRVKRGGGLARVALDEADAMLLPEAERLLALDQALARLQAIEPRLVRTVECRHFLGLTEEETAAALGVSLRTVQRDFRAASLWLKRELGGAAERDAE